METLPSSQIPNEQGRPDTTLHFQYDIDIAPLRIGDTDSDPLWYQHNSYVSYFVVRNGSKGFIKYYSKQ